MRSIARSFLAILLVASLLDVPAFAATAKPLGLVIQAKEALLDNSNLAVGTTVYPGDSVQTDDAGTLRLKFGTTQLYLLSSSAATFSQRENIVRATVSRGTVGFSTSAASDVELEIPEGILRAANGEPTYGQVTITGPQEVIIAAYDGSLILDNEGELHTIGAGKTYRVTMDLDPAAPSSAENGASQDTNTQDQGVVHTRRRRRGLVFWLVATGIVAVASGVIWYEVTQSPSKPK